MASDDDSELRIVALRRRQDKTLSAADVPDIEMQRQSLRLVRAFFRIASDVDRQKVVDLASSFAGEI